jgi:membrane protein
MLPIVAIIYRAPVMAGNLYECKKKFHLKFALDELLKCTFVYLSPVGDCYRRGSLAEVALCYHDISPMTTTSVLPGSEETRQREAAQLLGHRLPRPAPSSFWGQCFSLARYLTQAEVHTYAFSVAANAILSLCPFIVMMFTVARQIFHSKAMENVIAEMVRYFLPAGQDFVVKNLSKVAHMHHGVQIASLAMLVVSSTGVFLPLEIALNRVWGVQKNRSYLMNQLVSFGLAVAIGILAMVSVALTAMQHSFLGLLFLGHTNNAVYSFLTHWILQITATFISVLLFFLIYWILPNRKLPARAVLPTAIFIGLLWEIAKIAYISVLPWLDFRSVYGPFSIAVSLMMWAFLTGLLLLGGAHHSASRYTIRLAHQADLEGAKAEPSKAETNQSSDTRQAVAAGRWPGVRS